MRVILSAAAIASFLFACGSSSSPGGGVGADGGATGTSSGTGSSSSGGSSVTGSCPSVGHTYTLHFTYVSGGAMCMQEVPDDSTNTFDPDAGAPMPDTDAGESCVTNINGCSYSLSCTDADDAGNSSSVSVQYMVAGSGALTGTESITIVASFNGTSFNQMCVFSVSGTKIN